MFSKKRAAAKQEQQRQHEQQLQKQRQQQEAFLASRAPAPQHLHPRTTSVSTTASNAQPLVSPLQMTFDFELPPSPGLPSPLPSADNHERSFSESGRPQTSDGARKSSIASFAGTAPMLPQIPRVASKEEGMRQQESGDNTVPRPRNVSGSSAGTRTGRWEDEHDREIDRQPQQRPASPPVMPAAREEDDNVSATSSTERRSQIKSIINFDSPPDFLSFSRPSSSAGPRVPPETRPATSTGSTPKMESSLFPTREPSSPAIPSNDTPPPMSRAWIDSRDKPYGSPLARPPPVQPVQSSPDLHTATRTPSTKFSPRSPLSTNSPASATRPSPHTINTSPNFLHRPLSHAPTNLSGSTVRSTMSSKSTMAESPTITVGTPYQETSPVYPLPQHVATRPKTAGAAATSSLAGVSVPTHHTTSLPRTDTFPLLPRPDAKPAEKSERRKTRLLNPMTLLARRRSGQDEEAQLAEKAAQAALQRQKNVAAVGVSRLPEDFDPRIKGKVVHDFSAPRGARRNFSFNDAESQQRDSLRLQSTSSAPFIPALQEEEGSSGGYPRQSSYSNKPSDAGSKRSMHTGLFMEHFNDNNSASDSAANTGRIQAERLENKNFLQRASHLSTVSQESIALPPFARRSQTFDPNQASFFYDDDSKRGSGVSSLGEISPVTARSSAVAQMDGVSPVSPASPDKRTGKRLSEINARPDSGVGSQRPASDASSRDSGTGKSPSEQRPFSGSSTAAQQRGVETIAEEKENEKESPSQPPDSTTIPPTIHGPPEVPPRVASASFSPHHSPAPSGSLMGSALPSPSLSFPSDQPTPVPEVAQSVVVAKSPPKIVEKRASAVGHAKRRTGPPSTSGNLNGNGTLPQHRVSNASRFSFQFGGSAAEELALEEKYSRVATRDSGDVSGAGAYREEEEEEEEYFDEDAMDDMDEMEVQDGLQEFAPMSAQQGMRYRPTTPGGVHLREEEVEDPLSEIGDTEDEWTQDDSRDQSSLGFHSRQLSSEQGASVAQRSRAPSQLTLDTTDVMNKARNGFYMQPRAAGYSPTIAKDFTGQRLPQETARSFSSPEQRHFSQSTLGDRSSSGPRTNSTGLGLSGFSDFKFSDSAPSSRPMSLKPDHPIGNGRRKDSETIPSDVNWTDPSFENSPALLNRHSQGWGGIGRQSGAFNGRGVGKRSSLGVSNIIDDDDMYFDDGGFEQDVVTRPVGNSGYTLDEDAFDDDSFFPGRKVNGQPVHERAASRIQANLHQRDVSAMSLGSDGPYPSFAMQSNSHQRDVSAMSLGSDGPYPSFAMPNPIKARERDSRLLLEDLPLQEAQQPVDPMLIPRRNPSEDAKRLGLSSRAPPLPPPVGSFEAAQHVQAKLAAYHAALAEAANKAAAEGRFMRMPSTASTATSLSAYSNAEAEDASHHSRSEDEEVPPLPSNGANGDVVHNNGHETTRSTFDQGTVNSPPKLSFDFGFDAFNAGPPDDSIDAANDDYYDELLTDDDIVAAANAEVLASDDEGFYGHEFGFYAKARPNSGGTEAVNGGYFGMDGDDGLTRNKSLKEPNLTPITERSEFSTRNSFISGTGALGPPSAGPLSAGMSPALSRLPFGPLGEGEITSFDQLRKLRAHAFSGSQGSLHSDARLSQGSLHNPSSDSPTYSTRSSAAAQGYFGPLGGAPMTFAYSTDSSGSSNPSSGNLQQQRYSHGFQESPQSAASSGHLPFSMGDKEATPRRAPPQNAAESPPTARKMNSTTNKVQGHSRKSSGADSVTYVKEQDPAGNGPPRWVLERRRTSEQGSLELIAREIVQSGWI
ncbi:hypothetical protein LTR37_012057 [Vermiconidia calcicola]|uniref:Uncharacterized protein n=1 Tax=Vermiconidia calcicola TaxID=1690605 RepID=A0ACC3N0B7_9PEZI|nr:hypothetical protein LTR37_012057 [Vermiconidia calcicola]